MNSKDKDLDVLLKVFVGVMAILLTGPIVALVVILAIRKPEIFKKSRSAGFVIVGVVVGIVGVILGTKAELFFDANFLKSSVLARLPWRALIEILARWAGATGLALIGASVFVRVWRNKSAEGKVEVADFTSRKSQYSFSRFYTVESRDLPLGVDTRSHSVVALSEAERCSHALIIGATGTGKTTLMTNWILHAISQGSPCVVIDPKGDDSTLEVIRTLGKKICPNLDEKLKVFRMAKRGEASLSYNPLKHGNPNQLKDRVMEALEWSEQYYQSVSGNFLSVLLAAISKAGFLLTLDSLSKMISSKESQADLKSNLCKMAEKGDGEAEHLFELLDLELGSSKAQELKGLAAQIGILNNPTIGGRLSPKVGEQELDLREIYQHGQIAYFQLDMLSNADTARRLGRMIVEDLKSMASELYKVPVDERVFFPIFIDEFGSFASKEFIEFLKQVRGAKMATHLFCQGLEDLDAVSPEFRRQAISNPLTKIALRVDDRETVEEFVSTAGTLNQIEQSYQVADDGFGTMRTGMGNSRLTKQMRVEHDVLKNLTLGEAVVIQKSPTRVSGIRFPESHELIPS